MMRPEEAEAPTTRMDLSQLRPSIRRDIGQELGRDRQVASRAIRDVANLMERDIRQSGNSEYRRAWSETLGRMMRLPNLFDSADVKFGYDQRQRIYSLRVTLDNRPRILTLRLGEDFTELSMADLQGNVLAMARQEDGRGIRFTATQ
jgi:hypothetical protein